MPQTEPLHEAGSDGIASTQVDPSRDNHVRRLALSVSPARESSWAAASTHVPTLTSATTISDRGSVTPPMLPVFAQRSPSADRQIEVPPHARYPVSRARMPCASGGFVASDQVVPSTEVQAAALSLESFSALAPTATNDTPLSACWDATSVTIE